ncbi:amino acid adenylation domain-containing protein [Streptomyces sp. SLBN-115]|uniref:amino acid adenylation domain-containing protein n=1 Tax=Streptomyces sp. SLBN-115 TaxID=2768453 RepID=UPI001174D8E3|nr:amino acid adenylation domain-containing protein [Streptomyces sp. SLBN-115]TQJ37043.1 amino acid adenylation domain-containing protein [Streptomyces sp. SLBN-115]
MTDLPVPRPPTLLQRFVATVSALPSTVAVEEGQGRTCFAELAVRSAAVATDLLDHGVRVGDIVGLYIPRSTDFVVAALGVMQAGGAFLPLDPDYPADRVRYMVEDSGTTVVLTDGGTPHHPGELFPVGVSILPLAGPRPAARAALRQPAVTHGQIAYVLYTSGSTGRPKAVEVEHGALACFLAGLETAGVIRPGRARVGWSASPSFDASLQQWTRICRGDTVVILDDLSRRVPQRLVAAVAGAQLTDLDITPGLAEPIVDRLARVLPVGSGLRLWVGGEAVSPALWRSLAGHSAAGRLEAVSVYGTTETTVDNLWAPIEGHVAPHLGTPLPGQAVRLLDDRLRPVPVGEPGDLYVAGPTLARGYLGRPGLTSRRFLADPWASDGSRMYRTGDRARRTPDGRLEFLGRTDHQVKIRGYRVELGEVEAVLADHPGVLECVVVSLTRGGVGVLTAHMRTAPGTSVEEVRAHAARQLPEWMRPSTYSVVTAMPLTQSGKIDRLALGRAVTATGGG